MTDYEESRKRQHSKQLWLVCALIVLLLQVSLGAATTSVTIGATSSSKTLPFASHKKGLAFDVARSFPRGGRGIFSGTTADEEEDDDDEDDEEENNENDIRQHPEFEKLQAYRMKQQVLMQLRATILSESLAKRGLPIPSLKDVSTPDGKAPPKKVDWDCAMSTEADQRPCMLSYEAEVGCKVVVPMELASTDKWITLTALNRLRRKDPSKVEPMWSDQYAIISSWFSPNSRYSLLQHVGPKGVALSTLLDGNRLPTVVFFALVFSIVQLMPIIVVFANRLLVSSFLWNKWATWQRYIHMGLPFKLVIFQFVFSYLSKAFSALVTVIKDKLVDLECQILEETIPLTVGEGSEDTFEDVDITEDEEDDEDVDTEDEEDDE